jgi:predicted RNase H-like HicB family nuclease
MRQRITFEVTFPLHVLVYPAPDLDGQWIAHCLELDLVAQGDSDAEARENFADAFRVLVDYNVEHGIVPIQVKVAPQEIWDAAGLAI